MSFNVLENCRLVLTYVLLLGLFSASLTIQYTNALNGPGPWLKFCANWFALEIYMHSKFSRSMKSIFILNTGCEVMGHEVKTVVNSSSYSKRLLRTQ